MSSLAVAARLEFRRARRERALGALLVFFTIIALYAAWNGREWARDRQAALESVARQEQAEQDISLARVREAVVAGRSGGFDAAGLAAGLWNRPVLPQRALSFIASGQAQGYPYDARFHVMTSSHAIFDRAGADLGNPAAAAAGSFDLALVVAILLPLLLFAASYDLWAQEHETGTSLMVMSQPTSLSSVLTARILARGGALLVATTGVFVAILFGVGAGGAAVGEILGAATVMFLYGVFWLSIVVLVNVFAKRSAVAAITCVIVWLSLVLLIPAALATWIDLARPAAPQAELVNALRLQTLQLEEEKSGMAKLDRVARLRRELDDTEARDRKLGPLVRRYDDMAEQRRALADRLRIFSPAVLVQDAFERFAGTDADRAMSFRSQALAFQGELRAFVRDDRPMQLETLDAAIARIPRFRFVETNPRGAMARDRDLLWLVAWLVVVCCLILLALRSRGVSSPSRTPEIG